MIYIKPDGKPTGLPESFRYSFQGIRDTTHGRNFRIQFCLMLLAVGFGFWLDISAGEWQTVITNSGIVLGAETINTAVELLCDMVVSDAGTGTIGKAMEPDKIELRWDDRVRRIKDLASGAVSIVSLFAALNGAVIFLPKLLCHFGLDINIFWALW